MHAELSPAHPQTNTSDLGRPSAPVVRVLALDDDPVDLEILRRCLRTIEDMEFEFRGCNSLEEASKALAEERFDVLFIDYFLPGTTGIEVLEDLRATISPPPTILLTGSHREHVLHQALRAGVVDYAAKDTLAPALLETTIQSALAKAKLNKEIEQKQRTLEATVQSLTLRQEEIEAFYHNVSHELKTPLTGVREFVSLVVDGAAGPIGTAQGKLLGAAVRNCDQMVRCINDMLDAARIETGKLVLTRERADMCAIVRDAVDSLRGTAKAKGVTMTVTSKGNVRSATIDRHRMYQVVANLVSNAVKFSPDSGAVVIHVDGCVDSATVVTVTDSGVGIPPRDEERIFDRLYQSRTEDAAALGGLGMGLYISREIVQLHGGTIWVEQGEDGGAKIAFRLPGTSNVNTSAPLTTQLSDD